MRALSGPIQRHGGELPRVFIARLDGAGARHDTAITTGLHPCTVLVVKMSRDELGHRDETDYGSALVTRCSPHKMHPRRGITPSSCSQHFLTIHKRPRIANSRWPLGVPTNNCAAAEQRGGGTDPRQAFPCIARLPPRSSISM